jgi:hypothetical protein
MRWQRRRPRRRTSAHCGKNIKESKQLERLSKVPREGNSKNEAVLTHLDEPQSSSSSGNREGRSEGERTHLGSQRHESLEAAQVEVGVHQERAHLCSQIGFSIAAQKATM